MGHIKKILVPMDGSPSSLAALTQALTLAEDVGASIDVLHVNAAVSAAKSVEEESERDMESAIAEAAKWLGDRLSRHSEDGDPIRKILEAAAEQKADLIVMGTHGRVGRLHALIGSVAEAVVRSAPCPVLTVRHPDGEEESFSERIHHRAAIASQTRPSR